MKIPDPVSGGFILSDGDPSKVLLADNTWGHLASATSIREFGGCMLLGNGQLVPMKGTCDEKT